MKVRLALALVFVPLIVSLCGCGGGGGSGSVSPVTVVTAAPTSASSTFVAGVGPITAIPSSVSFGTTVSGTSTAADFIVQSASQPGTPTIVSQIAQSPISVTSTSGLATASRLRTASARSVEAMHEAIAADGLRESHGVDRMNRDLAALRPSGAQRQPADAVRGPRSNLGDQKVFKILYNGIGGATTSCPSPVAGYTCYVNITATLEAVSAHGYVWVDNHALGDPNQFPDQTVFQTTASNFESYFAIETSSFGPAYTTANINFQECDSNGNALASSLYTAPPDLTGQVDPHISIVITDALIGTGEGGYFYSGNLIGQNALNCIGGSQKPVSNGVPMVVIGSDNYGTPSANLPQYNPSYWASTDMPRSLSHEFQHFLHAVNKYFQPSAVGSTGVFDDSWIDEGCSMLAEDIAANGTAIDTPRYTYAYMLEPSLYSLTAFVGFAPNPISGVGPYGYYYYNAGNYGAGYLMMRYLYDRFGGSAALHRLYADLRPGQSGSYAGGGNLYSNVNPALSAANNESWPQLYGEWSIAIAAQSAGISTDPRYSFNPAIVLRGAVQVPSRRSAPYATRNLVFGGPQPPETFDGSGNLLGYVTLPVGGSASINGIDGATNFFIPSQGAAGVTLRASTGTLNAPQGAVVQGTLPTPMPTSY